MSYGTTKFDCIFYPKFHCEFNFIERYWHSVKEEWRQICDFKFTTLVSNIDKILKSVPLEKIQHYARKAFRYMSAYRMGETLSPAHIEWVVNKYSSHRRVPYDLGYEIVWGGFDKRSAANVIGEHSKVPDGSPMNSSSVDPS